MAKLNRRGGPAPWRMGEGVNNHNVQLSGSREERQQVAISTVLCDALRTRHTRFNRAHDCIQCAARFCDAMALARESVFEDTDLWLNNGMPYDCVFAILYTES